MVESRKPGRADKRKSGLDVHRALACLVERLWLEAKPRLEELPSDEAAELLSALELVREVVDG